MTTLAAAVLALALGLLLGSELTARRWRAHYRRLQRIAARHLEKRVLTL